MIFEVKDFSGSIVVSGKAVVTLDDASHKVIIFNKKNKPTENKKKAIIPIPLPLETIEVDRVIDHTIEDPQPNSKPISLKKGIYTYKYSSLLSAACGLGLVYHRLVLAVKNGDKEIEGYTIIK